MDYFIFFHFEVFWCITNHNPLTRHQVQYCSWPNPVLPLQVWYQVQCRDSDPFYEWVLLTPCLCSFGPGLTVKARCPKVPPRQSLKWAKTCILVKSFFPSYEVSCTMYSLHSKLCAVFLFFHHNFWHWRLDKFLSLSFDQVKIKNILMYTCNVQKSICNLHSKVTKFKKGSIITFHPLNCPKPQNHQPYPNQKEKYKRQSNLASKSVMIVIAHHCNDWMFWAEN